MRDSVRRSGTRRGRGVAASAASTENRKGGGGEKKTRRKKKYTPGCRYKCAAAISAIAGRDSLWGVKRNLFDSGRSNNNRWIGGEGLGCFFGGEPIPPTPPISSRSTRGSTRRVSLFVYRCASPPIHMSGPHSRPLISPAILGATGAARSGEFSRQPASKVSRISLHVLEFLPPPPPTLHPTHTRTTSRVCVIRRSSIPSVRTFIQGDLKHFSFCVFSLITRSSLPDSSFLEQNQRGKGRSSCLLISPLNVPDISEALLHFVLTAGVLTSNGTLGRPLG